MSDNMTFRGFVGTDVTQEKSAGGVDMVTFRMGCSERRFDRGRGEWVDAYTNWFTVQCFRNVADNVYASVKKGQRVIVVGKLRLRQYEKDGRIQHASEIKVESIGHDLMWGRAEYWRTTNNVDQEVGQDDE
jgi:single-strand DNA-binding protein